MEPKRQTDLCKLENGFRLKVLKILEDLKNRGLDPEVFETARTMDRQLYLHSIGRTRDRQKRPVTWTLKSKHLDGLAVDIISKTKGWNWNYFYDQLRECAENNGCEVLKTERCHVQACEGTKKLNFGGTN